MARPSFDLHHIVGFEETNLVGNVYFSNYFLWQGKCREMFLRQHAPRVLEELSGGRMRLVTAHASCDFADEFSAFDEVLVRMTLNRFIAFGVSLDFAYGHAAAPGGPAGEAAFEPLARGRQDIKFLRREAAGWALVEVPDYLMAVLQDYA